MQPSIPDPSASSKKQPNDHWCISHRKLKVLLQKCIMLPQIGIIQTGQIEGKNRQIKFLYCGGSNFALYKSNKSRFWKWKVNEYTCHTITVLQCLNIFIFSTEIWFILQPLLNWMNMGCACYIVQSFMELNFAVCNFPKRFRWFLVFIEPSSLWPAK